MFELLFDYSFLTVAAGTLLLALSAACIGSISVLSKQSLIGDALGHAAYPGVILAFMLTHMRQPFVLMLGALFSIFLANNLINIISFHHKQSTANALALVSSTFFGFGILLKNYIQGHAHYANSAQAGLQSYLFGQAAFIRVADLYLIAGTAFICLTLFARYYQLYKLYLFDPHFARLVGVNTQFLRQLALIMMVTLIAVGLKLVGTFLMAAFLITPATFGLLWRRNYLTTLIYASLLAVISTLVGTFLSSAIAGLSTGPTIIVGMALTTLLTLLAQHHRQGGNKCV